MSESEPRSEAEDPPFSLDLDACARVLAEQQCARTIEREVEKAKERLCEAAARSLVAHVLSQLPAALAADDRSFQVRVPPPAGVGEPRGASDLACRYLNRYFGITDEQAKQGTGWQLYGSGPFFVSRPLLTSIVERMTRETATETTAKTCGNCKHLGCLPPPRMSRQNPPRVLEVYGGPGKCLYPAAPVPMVEVRRSAWISDDATKCSCWEPKP